MRVSKHCELSAAQAYARMQVMSCTELLCEDTDTSEQAAIDKIVAGLIHSEQHRGCPPQVKAAAQILLAVVMSILASAAIFGWLFWAE